jgi:hypothetical protein
MLILSSALTFAYLNGEIWREGGRLAALGYGRRNNKKTGTLSSIVMRIYSVPWGICYVNAFRLCQLAKSYEGFGNATLMIGCA